MEPCPFVICTIPSKQGGQEADLIYKRLTEAGFTFTEDRPKLIVILGGDGSFFYAVHQYRFRGDFLLINSGHLGFFADYDIEQLEECLDDIVANEEVYEKLPIYEIYHDGKRARFISDLSLEAHKTSEYSLSVDETFLTKGRASGIVISTPSGSTGYNSSLGSPVVLQDADIYQYSFVASVFNKLYPNIISKGILSSSQTLKIKLKEENTIFIDGQERGRVSDDELFIKKSDETLNLIHFKDSDNLIRIKRCLSITQED